MTKLDNFIEASLRGIEPGAELYRFRQKLNYDFDARANDLRKMGVTDPAVIEQIIMKDHPNLAAEFAAFCGGAVQKPDKKKKKNFFVIRSCLFILIILVSVFLFLAVNAMTAADHSFLIIIGGVALAFFADGVIINIKKQKFATVNNCIYFPIICSLLYVIGGISGVLPWHPGWLLIVGSVFADVLFILIGAIRKSV